MSPSAPRPDRDPTLSVSPGEVPGAADPLVDPPDGLPPPARRRLWLLGTDAGLWRLRLGIVALGVLGFLAFIAVGANRPPDPILAPEPPRTPPAGFGETGFSITTGEGVTSTGCAVLANAEAQWQEGFMHKRAIPGYDAMVFDFPAQRDGAFFNRNVPITLDIAWFDDNGDFVDAARMPPCEDAESCPLYRPRAPYRRAVETPVGGLTRLGAGPGAKLELTGPCEGG
ncbi:MAG: DUF192 domain-containing protein [Actinobacteria bacterium]|nr:DUF192 domain-containing protein [Actinomycetota bacterium]